MTDGCEVSGKGHDPFPRRGVIQEAMGSGDEKTPHRRQRRACRLHVVLGDGIVEASVHDELVRHKLPDGLDNPMPRRRRAVIQVRGKFPKMGSQLLVFFLLLCPKLNPRILEGLLKLSHLFLRHLTLQALVVELGGTQGGGVEILLDLKEKLRDFPDDVPRNLVEVILVRRTLYEGHPAIDKTDELVDAHPGPIEPFRNKHQRASGVGCFCCRVHTRSLGTRD